MLSHRHYLAFALLIWLPCMAVGQEDTPKDVPVASNPQEAQEDADLPPPPDGFDLEGTAATMLEEIENARFKLTPGFDAENGVSLSATSRIAHAFDFENSKSLCSFAVFDGKGEWSSAEESTNHAEASLSSTLAYCRVNAANRTVPVVVGFTGDLRSKWGEFEEGDGDQKTTVKGNQSLLGGGFTLLFQKDDARWKGLELTASYYRVLDSEGNLTVPEELDVDHIQARLKTQILPFAKRGGRLKDMALIVDGRASQAVEGPEQGGFDYYTSLALEFGTSQTLGTVRWEKGKEVGFEYDKKLVLGVAIRLLGLGD